MPAIIGSRYLGGIMSVEENQFFLRSLSGIKIYLL